jgi:hypothetical protein
MRSLPKGLAILLPDINKVRIKVLGTPPATPDIVLLTNDMNISYLEKTSGLERSSW